MLTACGLGIRHRNWLVRGLDLELHPSDILAVLGPNGRGKSSLLRVLAGLASATEGLLNTGHSTSYVPQTLASGLAMTCFDYVLAGRARQVGWLGSPGAADRDAARDAMRRLGIAHLSAHGVGLLSGGERQLLAMARAIATGCRTMLLDEPAAALDYRNQAVMLSVLRDLAASGLAIVFTTHAPQHAFEIAHRTLLLHGPGHHDCGPTAAVATDAALSRLYGLPIHCASLDVDGLALRAAVPLYGTLRNATTP